MLPIMVTTRAGHAKWTSAELDYDDGKNHGMYLGDVKTRVTEQATMQCANLAGAKAKEWVEMNLNPPPPFESDDDGGDEVDNSGDKFESDDDNKTIPFVVDGLDKVEEGEDMMTHMETRLFLPLKLKRVIQSCPGEPRKRRMIGSSQRN